MQKYGKTLNNGRFFPIFYNFAEKFNVSAMKYNAVDFKIRCDEALMQTCRELLADAAGEAGFESFEDTEEGLKGYVQTDLFHAVQLDEAIQSFPIEGVDISYEVSEVEDQDWNETWEEQGFDPIIIDERCIIYDARQQGDTPLCAHLAPLRIGIEARMAFGTGTHETTRMVVSRLLDLPLEGKRVLDCGCGTGILAIVAAKCGAREAIAYDIDEWSVKNTLHNAELNDVSCITALCGDSSVLSHVSGVFDVVLANINRNILLADMRHFAEVLATDGTLILSGFYEEDVALITTEAQKHGLHPVGTTTENNWACVAFKR